MSESGDTNAAIWQSGDILQHWTAEAANRHRRHGPQWRLMAELLPFAPRQEFTFLDLGAGTGAASQAVLARHERSSGILADFSAQMMGAGQEELKAFAGRYRYVEFDLAAGGRWPEEIPGAVDAVITSLSVHHLLDERKQALFAEILDHLVPGGWYLNYDPVQPADEAVGAVWERVADLEDPAAAEKRHHPTPEEQARHANHVRYMIPLAQQLEYLRAAGFQSTDVFFKRLEWVIHGGRRPA
ncbi:MAG TPA: class I SAM-dependent methyltransferase [Streptosporangiaceae bacterium]|jgi:tRNA (cmo5U34)-methyltransferase